MLLLATGALVQACTSERVVGVVVVSIEVLPQNPTVAEGDSLEFRAVVTDDHGNVLTDAPVVWSTDDPQKLSIDSKTGVAHALLHGRVTVTATYQGEKGTATVTVSPTAGFIVSPVSGPTTEAGGQATFTVSLTKEPTEDVKIALASSDTTEGKVSPDTLTFTPGGSLTQTATVTGQDDAIDDGDVEYSIVISPSISADLRYEGITLDAVSVTNVDDDGSGFAVSAMSGPTTEAGAEATFTVALDSQPTADVTIGLTSSDTTEAKVSPSSLTFTDADWSVPQTVRVTGQDDALPDGNVAYSIVTAPATSTDPNYEGLDAPDVSGTNVDNETAGVTVSSPSGPTSEAGDQATFTIVLNAQPSADVTIGLTSSNTDEGTISAPSVTFMVANWDVPQTVTVTGQDDAVDDGDRVYTVVTAPATSADPNYNSLDADDVTLTNVDDDTAGFAISPVSGPTTEAGGTAQFTVALTSQPTANVTIGLTSDNTSEGTVGVSSLTFTLLDWNLAQTVTVTGQNDAVADGNVQYAIVTAPATSADSKYAGLDAADVSVTNVDDETPGITVSAASGPTTESGGTATFSVVLNTQPSADVTIGLSSSDTSEGTISVASLTFTNANWNVAQTVTVTGQNDDVDDGDVAYKIVTSQATSADFQYLIDPDDVSFTNIDDETAGVTVSPISGPTTEAGGQAFFTVVLNSEPTADVTIGISSSNTGEGTVTPSSVMFATSTWNVAQTVTVVGVDDAVADGNAVYTIVTAPAASSDLKYNGLNANDVSVTNVDNETAGITVSPVSGPTTEAGGQATFTVELNTQPTADVTIGISSSDETEGTVTPATLTFTDSDWDAPQLVTVTGVDDDVDDDNVVYTVITSDATSTDASYAGLNAADVSVTNNDDDTAGITVSPPSGPTTEFGGTATFTVLLNSEPTADVTIDLSSDDETEGVVTSPASGSLTFTATGWDVAQTVTVTGQDDAGADGNVKYHIVTAPAISGDTKYDGKNAMDVLMTNVDNETVGISVSPISGPTTEAGGSATFTVKLDTQPSDDVSIALSSDDQTEGTVTSPASKSLTFTSTDWSTPQTVTVTGVDDFVDDGNIAYNIVTAPATSGDPAYDGWDAADVSVTNVDDDGVGFTVSPISGPTTEGGDLATFTVRLTSQPADDVTFSVSSDDSTEGVVTIPAIGSLTFTPADWDTDQTVTVQGQNDDIDDGNVLYHIVTGSASSADTAYDGLDPVDVFVTNVDDGDTAGVIVTPTGGLVTTEASAGTDQFTVALNSEPIADVTVALVSNDPSEGQVSDPVGGSLTFTNTNWSTARTVTVQGQDDAIDDGDVSYMIVTTTTSGGDPKYNGIATSDVGVTTIDNDTSMVSINDVTVTEGNSGSVNATFTLTLSVPNTQTVTVDYSTASGTATAGTDFTSSTGTVTFNAGATSAQLNVPVTGDLIDEGASEAFTVQLSNPVNGTIADGSGTGTITDDDNATLSINDVIVTEGNSGTTNATFTVTKSLASSQAVTVAYATADGTAIQPDDYTSTSGTLTFPALGALTQTVTVPVIGDLIDEGASEAFTVELSNPSNATIADASGTGTITDDDGATLSIDDVTTTEGNSGTVNATFTVTKSLVSSQTVTVQYGTTNGTATAGADYTATSGTLTFAPGETTKPISVPIIGDALDEPDETFTVTLSSPSNATIADGSGTGTITDDDPTPSLSINTPAAIPEGNTGTTNLDFTVTLSAASGRTVTVNYATADGTATQPGDYTSTSGALTFNPGETTKTVSVAVVGDALDETDETFTVTLSNPSNATISTATGTGTITDDDPPPTLSINTPAAILEGNTGTANLDFTVTLSSVSGRTVTVDYATADGTATQPGDYTSTSGTLTFNPGEATKTVSVPVVGDALDETNETFTVTLSNPSNATISTATGTGTITDDDPTPSLSINTPTAIPEGNTGTTNLDFMVTLSAASGQTVTVDYATADGTANQPADYTSTSGTLTFNPGETGQQVTVSVNGDTTDEPDETLTVTLSIPSNATISTATGTGTITDDDPPPNMAISDVSLSEGDAGTRNATFTVSLSAASGKTVTVQYATADGTATTADADYVADAGTLTFNPGETSQQVNVAVNGDTTDEPDETFTVGLNNATNATITDASGTGTITNDDPPPSLSINSPAAVNEGDSGTTTIAFTVTLSAASGRTVTVDYTTADGTATAADADYVADAGTLTFAPGETTKTVSITINGDTFNETDETFAVDLSNETNATISNGSGTGTITNDDPTPSLSINTPAAILEGNSGTTPIDFTVTLSAASGQTVSVDFATADGTATTTDSDYVANSGTLTFAPGETSKTVTVQVNGDTTAEPNETFTVNLSNESNATIVTATGTGTITNDDP